MVCGKLTELQKAAEISGWLEVLRGRLAHRTEGHARLRSALLELERLLVMSCQRKGALAQPGLLESTGAAGGAGVLVSEFLAFSRQLEAALAKGS